MTKAVSTGSETTNGSELVGKTVVTTVTSDKAAGANDTKIPTKTSYLNVVLFCVLLVGVGGILGYLVFYSVYNHRCSDMMDDAERHFNSTQQDLQNKLIEALHRNTDNEVSESELLELRGRMEGQADLMSRHEGLLEKHQRTMEQLTAAQYSHEQALLLKKQIEHELDITRAKVTSLEENLGQANREQGTLAVQLKRSQDMVANLSRRNEELASNTACEEERAVATNQIQELHVLLTKQSFGEAPNYYLKFSLSVDGEPEDENTAFIVEVSTLHQLPHAVFSFMMLQQAKVYDGVEFLPTNSIVYVDSDEKIFESISHVKSAFRRIETTADGNCTPYSVGFVGDTGGLKLVMTRDSSKHGSLACFGTIVHGRQFISRMQMSPKQGKTMSIRKVEQVHFPQRSKTQEGEL